MRLLRGGIEIPLLTWAAELHSGVANCARWLDEALDDSMYLASAALQKEKLDGLQLTPAEELLARMSSSGEGYYESMLALARNHRDYFADRPLPADIHARFVTMAEDSLARQRAIEAADDLDFESYLRRYYAQYESCGCSEVDAPVTSAQ